MQSSTKKPHLRLDERSKSRERLGRKWPKEVAGFCGVPEWFDKVSPQL